MSQQDTVSGQLNYPCPETDHNQIWLLPKNDFSPKDGVSPENGFLQKLFCLISIYIKLFRTEKLKEDYHHLYLHKYVIKYVGLILEKS